MDLMTLLTLIGVLLVLLGFLGGGIYWMGTVASKLDSLIAVLVETRAESIVQSGKIEDLDRRLTHLEDRP